MKTATRILVLATLLAAGPLPAAEDAASPPGLKPETIATLAKIRTVAMMPVRIDEIAGKRPDVARHCADLVEARLRAAGFAVVPPAAYSEIRDRINHDLGGIYDPVTGRLKEDKAKALAEYLGREFDEKYPHEAVVFSGIVEHAAEFNGFTATWHGVEESSTGGKDGFWDRLNNGVANKYGRMPALSLGFVFRGPDDKAIYGSMGGVQLASRIGKTIERLPPESLLNDPAKIDNAARIAFEDLDASAAQIRQARGEPPAGAPSEPAAAAPAATGAGQ